MFDDFGELQSSEAVMLREIRELKEQIEELKKLILEKHQSS